MRVLCLYEVKRKKKKRPMVKKPSLHYFIWLSQYFTTCRMICKLYKPVILYECPYFRIFFKIDRSNIIGLTLPHSNIY